MIFFGVKKAFSLVEIVFVLAIISLVLLVAAPKLQAIFKSTSVSKIKSEVLLIQEGLNSYKNKMILTRESSPLVSLDQNDQYLFDLILEKPILASSKTQLGSWSKISSTTYKVYVEDGNSVEFVFDFDDYSFECDSDNLLCQELIY